MNEPADCAPECAGLESHPIFEGVSAARLTMYRLAFRERTYRRSSVLFHQGDEASTVVLILRGRVGLNRVTTCGKEIAPALLGPGGIAGADALFEQNGPRTGRAIALTDASVLVVAASDLMRIVMCDGTIAANIVRALCVQHEATVATLEELATLNVVDRIARFLGRLAAPGDDSSSDTLHIGLPLTHQQIAAFVSSSRETVSLEMGRLARSGRVVRVRHGYAMRRDP